MLSHGIADDGLGWTTVAEAFPGTHDEGARIAEMRASFRAVKRMTAAELTTEQRAAAPSWSEAEVARWVDAKQRFDLAALGYVAATDAVDWAAVLPGVRCPVLPRRGAPLPRRDGRVAVSHAAGTDGSVLGGQRSGTSGIGGIGALRAVPSDPRRT